MAILMSLSIRPEAAANFIERHGGPFDVVVRCYGRFAAIDDGAVT